MITKGKYIEQTGVKVKNLLSELFEDESEIQKELIKTKEKLTKKIEMLESEYRKTSNKRHELQTKFDQLKSVGDMQWESAKDEFELLINYVEGDRESFINKAELVIQELGDEIQEIEDKAVDAASDAKSNLTQKAEELKIYQKELQEKVDVIKNDTGERWRDIKHWFIEKSHSIKEYMSTI